MKIIIDDQVNAKIIEMAKQVKYTQEEIAEATHVSLYSVCCRMKENGIMSIKQIRKLMSQSPEISDEELARIANVNVEGIVNLREKLREKSISGINEVIIKLAKEAKYNPTEIARKTQVSSIAVYRKLKEHSIMTLEQIKKLIIEHPEMSDEEIAKRANVNLDGIQNLRKEKENKENKIDETNESIIKLAREARYKQGEIAKMLQTSQYVVCYVMKEHGVMPLRKIKGFIVEHPEMSDAEIAKAANVNVDGISFLRKAKGTPKKSEVKSREKYSSIIKLAKKAKYTQEEIAQIVQTSQPTVCKVFLAYRIMTLKQIKKLIIEYPEMSDEEIAKIANVNIEGIQNLRNIANEKHSKTKIDRRKKLKSEQLNYSQGIDNDEDKDASTQQTIITPENKESAAKQQDIPESIKKKIKFKLGMFPAIVPIANEFRVPRELVEQLYEEMQLEKYSRTHTESCFKDKMRELLSAIKKEQTRITETDVKSINHKAEVLLNEFSQFLKTEYDYALIAYAYVKAREYLKAITVAESHLGIEGATMDELKGKLQEIMSGKNKKAEEVKTKNQGKKQKGQEPKGQELKEQDDEEISI